MGRHKNVLRSGPAESLADQRFRILGFTQDEMARRLKCSQSFLSQVECGRVVPSNVKEWARQYGKGVRKFKSLADNQFILPLWRFAHQETRGETVELKSARKVVNL